MTRHRVRAATGAERARAAFRDYRGSADESVRAAQIVTLPVVEWRGQKMYTVECHGETGRGPHLMNVSEHLLWSLIDLRAYRCAWHM